MTYTFKCKNCGEFDISISHTEVKEFIKCPKCKGNSRREYKPIRWKVPGGYNDIYKNKNG